MGWRAARPRGLLYCAAHHARAILARWLRPIRRPLACRLPAPSACRSTRPQPARTRTRLNQSLVAMSAALLAGLALFAARAERDATAAERGPTAAAIPDNLASVAVDPPQVVLD